MFDELYSTDYWLTRLCFQRALGFIYLVAFLIAANQYLPLLGERGLMPVRHYLQAVRFRDHPSLVWLNPSDKFIRGIIWCGVALSVLAVTGVADAHGIALSVAVWALLWVLYLSLVNVGQTFYGFGWEIMLLEAGFLAIFLGSSDTRAPAVVMWLIVWMLFRTMFGAGMIKIHGDPCWRDLTCMVYHYETQPLPNPVSWHCHHLPVFIHKAGVLFNHFVELVVPWFLFAPAPLRHVAAGLIILFQLMLIITGNFSWLNHITIVLAIACFDDVFLSQFLTVERAVPDQLPAGQLVVVTVLAVFVAARSVRPARNLFSRRQLMNASFDPLHLVNTYGAFGSITRERFEIIIKGTNDEHHGDSAAWREYEFKGKPGNPARRPCIVSPYHYKLDWQMWFAAMSPSWSSPWVFDLVTKLLEGDARIIGLLESDPFPEGPPKYIRADLYRYKFTRPGDPGGNWWTREYAGEYLPATSLR